MDSTTEQKHPNYILIWVYLAALTGIELLVSLKQRALGQRALRRPRRPAISGRPYRLALLCARRDDVGYQQRRSNQPRLVKV